MARLEISAIFAGLGAIGGEKINAKRFPWLVKTQPDAKLTASS